jgi:subtilisin family serine protease
MSIAMLDAGFTNYTTLRAFDSINANNQVLDTWDFVSRHANVNDHSHGMQCLSTIAANIPGQFIGKAPKASFYLYRTEDAPTEYPIEEHNWACGAERADSSGADVISTSLGYTTFDPPLTGSNHTYNDMNGNTTMAAIGADLATKKGLMVFASAGNDGNSPWHFLSTPSDGDSVICVGAVDTLGNVAGFSSYGPSSDGQIKPDMASIGWNAIIQGTANNIVTGNGTSFACPNMAGLGTCLWQGIPEFNHMKIVQAMRQAGSIAATPNDRIGYGIPDMKKAFSNLLVEYATSSATLNNCSVTLNWNSKDVAAMKYEIERKAAGDTGYIKISEVNPQAGDVVANHSYQFTNILSAISAGTISYRIRQVIDTAASSFAAVYIDTANVSLASDCIATTQTPDRVRVVPNPAPAQVSLEVETSYAVADMPVNIYDAKGRLMHKMKLSKGIGNATFPLQMERFAAGTYYISVYNGDKLIGTTALLKL